MLRLIRSRTLADLQAAVFELQDRLAAVDPHAVANCPAFGCVGCGAWMADVVTAPSAGSPIGESFCWRCVRRRGITGYQVLPGREPQGGR
ncbi:hypothetical protein O7598_31130 [Micromonospora sp. WMMC241]|uniref:hypothetical protein n=1 Tax=Micromonospora sp. WMMC241 TaxID=3015159 RepID=UPI0022B604A4|nr:hypothetical protein [Micromonospora sp. WMMC241]MCZ7440794.1 hypothetical protein [Micromonospora sp. WMMC241]MCZ7440879.1 hypothetical protein [Micromonospora sp. WMMC241]